MSSFTLESESLPLRQLPAGSYLVHATNCIATWGAGIAAELATIFPAACKEYKQFCNATKENKNDRWPSKLKLVGKCLVIPPQAADIAAGAPAVHIVCVFTSYGFGRPNRETGKPGRDNVTTILKQTETSLKSFQLQLQDEKDVIVYSPMFNAGAFGVPWEKTVAIINTTFGGWNGRWIVLEPPK